jgi:hypothetical protein
MAEKHEQRIGLTLVELLVTVAIIFGIFGALSYLAHPERILAKSRDAQRLHDITALYKAISLGLSKGELSLVPTNRPGQSTVGTQAVDGTGWASFSVPAGKLGLMLYMHLLPIDPVNTTIRLSQLKLILKSTAHLKVPTTLSICQPTVATTRTRMNWEVHLT